MANTIDYDNIVAYGDYAYGAQVSGNGTYYIASPSFYTYHTIQGGNFWAAENGSVAIYYWNGSSWVNCFSETHPEQRWGNSHTIHWTHNWQSYSSGDNHTIHLYKVVFNAYGDGYSSGVINFRSIARLSRQEYDDFFKTKKIKSSAVGYSTDSEYEDGSKLDADLGSGSFRGNKIYPSLARYLSA